MANAKTGKKVIRRRREKKNIEKVITHLVSRLYGLGVEVEVLCINRWSKCSWYGSIWL